MTTKPTFTFLFCLAFVAGLTSITMAEESSKNDTFPIEKFNELQKQGNFNEAVDLAKAYFEKREARSEKREDDNLTTRNSQLATGLSQPYDILHQTVVAMARVNRIAEADAFLENIVAKYPEDSKMLCAVAKIYAGGHPLPSYGFRVNNQFKRGPNRSGGEHMMCEQRDRVRSLQLMVQAEKCLDKSGLTDSQKGYFYLDFANMFLNRRHGSAAWELQTLTDIFKLPDYQSSEDYYNRPYYGGPHSSAPVDEQGNPVFYFKPESFETAKSDGERWRYLLDKAEQYESTKESALRTRAQFALEQFGEQTIAGINFNRANDEEENLASRISLLASLTDDETIARLATGIKRFTLPEDYNYIKLYKQLNDWEQLGQIYLNRRQFPQAAQYYKQGMDAKNEWAKQQYEQIVNPWGQMVSAQQNGMSAKIGFLFRNATLANFTVHRIDVDALIEDAKNEIRFTADPRKWVYDNINLDSIAYRLILRHQDKYKKEQILKWNTRLEPAEKHFDKQVDIDVQFPNAGAYLIESIVAGGNIQYGVIWINNTVLVKKNIDGKFWFFVADSNTGEAIPGADVNFFGFKIQHNPNIKKQETVKKEFSVLSDKDGQFTVPVKDLSNNFEWLITVQSLDKKHKTFHGFQTFWGGGREFKNAYDTQYNAIRVYSMTDRPVYRPGQKVQYKFWARHSQYDKDGSDFAGKTAQLLIFGPRDEQLLDKQITFDEFGGYAGDIELSPDAKLGQYVLLVKNEDNSLFENNYFRVEEYKKPEFLVEVKAPEKPVQLGEKITASVKAKYYFGEPVAHATAKIKVTRTEYNDRWFPAMPWDWLYGRGYWWFAYEYPWYPGWNQWGCCCPYPVWHHFPHNPPEVVYEKEAELKPDGTYDVEIDTAIALAIFGKQNQQYDISVEVTDASRRTINGSGKVLVAAKPFSVCAWLDRGIYHVGDQAKANFKTQTLDNKPVTGKGTFKLYKVTYDKNSEPVESEVWTTDVNPDENGSTVIPFNLKEAGQFRAEYTVDDGAKHVQKGAQLFTVRGDNFDSKEYRFSDLEIIPDRETANPGDVVRLTINTDQSDAVVWLFPRAANGICLAPVKVDMNGKTGSFDLNVELRDMPNFFVEAVTVAKNRVFSQTRQICVPPAKRILTMDIIPSKENYKPGEDAKAKIVLKDMQGKPFVGQAVVTIYDKSLEYIASAHTEDITSYFWNWKRSHSPDSVTNSLKTYLQTVCPEDSKHMQTLGMFGHVLLQDGGAVAADKIGSRGGLKAGVLRKRAEAPMGMMMNAAPAPAMAPMAMGAKMEANMMEEAPAEMAADSMDMAAMSNEMTEEKSANGEQSKMATAVIRTHFADSAYWTGAIVTDENGEAEISLKMPENLTTWKIKAWAMGKRTEVGQAETEVITRKNLIIRAQTPRFLVQTDKIVLSAIVHNYLDSDKEVQIKVETSENLTLEEARSEKREPRTVLPHDLANDLQPINSDERSANLASRLSPLASNATATIKAGSETRVDWTFTAQSEGEATVRMFALTDEESDAMEVKFPIITHGILKQDSFSGAIRSEEQTASQTIEFSVPQQRKAEQTRLEVRYSPTLAGAMFDAIPYLIDYPYGCTEQTLNRFLPAAMCQKVVRDMGVDISKLEQKHTNLNAQEIGKSEDRAKQWKKTNANPVFNLNEMDKIVKDGLQRLTDMQCSDGGWGWFSGYGEYSSPHTTAVVVHGLTVARLSDVKVEENVLKRGVDWLQRYENEQIELLKRGDEVRNNPDMAKKYEYRYRNSADNIDALVYTVLVESGRHNPVMGEYLYRDRLHLTPYAMAMIGLAYDMTEQVEKRDMVIRNLTQYLRQDKENQTAWLDLGGAPYWFWYGSEIEAQAWYLKLLCRTDKLDDASQLVKYLLNNRKHATYWNSTRDTALVLEAFAEYLKKSAEMAPDMTVDVVLDGKTVKTVKINADNLFDFDGSFVLEGTDISDGKHTLELKRTGKGNVYFNAYVNYFTLEDFIPASGLEIKVARKYYKLVRDESATQNAVGQRGQAVEVKIDKYVRQELKVGDTVQSGDIILVDLTLESKNDYEYLLFEDKKPAGFEPLDVRSGYNGNEIGAYVEFRDQKVCFFCRTLRRGQCSVSYKLRAEMPGVVSALPATGEAMYAPELKANSDEFKIQTVDK